MPAKLDINSFITKAKQVHGDIYDYSLSVYEGSTKHILIICPVHGSFYKTPSKHLLGQGCPECSKENKKDTLENFILKANKVHNNFYDYSKSVYTKSKDNINIICKNHGEFSIIASNHLQGQGCPSCNNKLENFIKNSCKIHNNFYNYSKVEYKNNSTKVCIICPIHGEFFQTPSNHIQGKGCITCGQQSSAKLKYYNTESFIKRANIVHNNKYSYSSTIYQNFYEPVSIICSKHGIFNQRPYMHLYGNGCPKCSYSISKAELEIVQYIKSLGIDEQDIQMSYRLENKQIDIYLKKYNLAIEYNGTMFHHSSNSEYVSDFALKTQVNPYYHYDKWKLCFDNGIILISIYDFYWNIESKKDILKSKIKHYLGLDKKIFARKTSIKEIDNNVAYDFYSKNHLEGKGLSYGSSKSYGLFLDDKLLMAATVGKIYNQSSKVFKNKLHRICTLKGHTVVGGISKLNKYLSKIYPDYSYQILLSSGGSSLKCSDYRIIKPRYFWVHPNTLKYYHRNSTQKAKLEKTFKKPLKDLSETKYMESLGFLKVYDNGLAEIFIKES